MDNIKTSILRALGQATDYYEASQQQNNENAYQYYNRERPGIIDDDVTEYFQGVVSSDVSDAVDHTLADIMPAFAASSPVEFIPNSPEDEIQTQIETQVVNNIFFQQSDGFVQLLTASQDALLRRIGVIEVQVYEKLSVQYLELENVDINILAQYTQDKDVEIQKINGEMVEDLQENVLSSTFTVELKKTTRVKQLYVDAFPPDELRLLPESEEVDLDNSQFVARVRLLTRSELVELGYDKDLVNDLPKYGTDTNIKPHKQRPNDFATSEDSTHRSNDKILTAFIYMRIDEDNDGIAELRRIVVAGNLPSGGEILEDKPTDYQPFAIGVPYLYAHRTYGTSLYDKLKQVQDIKSKVTRQLLTAGERAVRGRLGVVGQQVNMKDIRESMFGGIVRMTTPNGVVPIPVDRYPAEVAGLLDIADKQRKESGGSAVDKASEEILVGGDTAHGLERIMSAMEQLNSLVAKLLAETLLRQTYRKIHAMLKKHFTEPTSANVNNMWVTTTPAAWPTRQHIKAALGLTMGDRLRQAAAYDRLLVDHKELLSNGSTVVNDNTLYQLLIARANALALPTAYSFYIDPKSPEGQQAASAKQQAQQQAKQEAEQQSQLQFQMLGQIESIKAQSANNVQQLKNEIKGLELQLKQASDNNDLALQYDELQLKLIELNAKYDAEKVPDAL